MAQRTRTLTVAETTAKHEPLPFNLSDEKVRAEVELEWGEEFTPQSASALVSLLQKFQFRARIERHSPKAVTLTKHLKATSAQIAALLQGLEAANSAGVGRAIMEHLEALYSETPGAAPDGLPRLRLTPGAMIAELNSVRDAIDILVGLYGAEGPKLLVHRSGDAWEEWVRDLTAWAEQFGYRKGATASGHELQFMKLVQKLGSMMRGDVHRSEPLTGEGLGKAIARARTRE
jgi:hypothetical protein